MPSPALGMPSAPQSTKPTLTFGLELEFVVATFPNKGKDPHPSHPRPVYRYLRPKCSKFFGSKFFDNNNTEAEKSLQLHMSKTLCQNGIESFCDYSKCDSDNNKNISWLVTNDSSIESPDSDYNWVGVEVISPVYLFDRRNLSKVENVCEVLNNTYRINLHKSCGVYVHVGNKNLGFPTADLRNLMAILWTFEPQLCTLHSALRFNKNKHCQRLRTHSYLGMQLKKQNMTAKDCLEVLLYSTSTNDLIDFLTSDEGLRLGYNFRNLKEADVDRYGNVTEASKNTIEFRQHEASLDAKHILKWIQLCIGLVEFARTVDRNILEPFLMQHIDDTVEDFSVVRVLVAVGLSDLALYYETRIAPDHGNREQHL